MAHVVVRNDSRENSYSSLFAHHSLQDSEAELDKAYSHYLKHPKPLHLASRAAFFLTSLLSSRMNFLDAAAVFSRAGERIAYRYD